MKISKICIIFYIYLLFCSELTFARWTWMKGDKVLNSNGVYDSPTNSKPGARTGAIGWKDNSGTFWMFGGNGRDANGTAAGKF